MTDRLRLYDAIPPASYWIEGYTNPAYLADLKQNLIQQGREEDEVQSELDFTLQEQIHGHDYSIYEATKRLGILSVQFAYPNFDYHDPETGLSLAQDTSMVSIHLPFVPREFRNRHSLDASCAMLVAYMFEGYLCNGFIPPEHIVGVTYAKLGRVAAKALGFSMVVPEVGSVPDQSAEVIKREGFAALGDSNPGLVEPVIIHKPTLAFIQDTVDKYRSQ